MLSKLDVVAAMMQVSLYGGIHITKGQTAATQSAFVLFIINANTVSASLMLFERV